MKTLNWKWKARFLTSGFGALAAAASSGEILTVVADGNVLLTFDHAAQGTTFSSQGITGLQPGEQILAIDFRPARSRLFALGSSNRTYRIDPVTGTAAAVGHGAFTPALAGWQFVYSGALDSRPRDSTSVTARDPQLSRLTEFAAAPFFYQPTGLPLFCSSSHFWSGAK